MKICWIGHSSFRIEIGDQVLLVDPWIDGGSGGFPPNPLFEGQNRADAIAGATAILVSHGHGDHAGEAVALAKETGATLVGIYDLMSFWGEKHGLETVGFNKGGTVQLGDVAVTMVNAAHSSSVGTENGPGYAGAEAGFMISGEGKTVYFSGDTDVMADMAIFQALHEPDIGILCAGGHFTMDMRRAAYAAKTFFDFDVVIPCHYKTFPLLEQSAEVLVEALPDVRVIEPVVMEPIEL